MTKLSFVIPCYNSEKTIGSVVDSICSVMENASEFSYDIVLVNDYSPDNTITVLKKIANENNNITVVNFAKNFGQHAALMAGLRHTTGEIIVFLDDDGQSPSDQILNLIKPLFNGYDLSIADYGVKKQSFFKNFGSKVNDIMAENLINKPKNLNLSSFLAFRRYIAEDMMRYENSFPYIGGLLLRATNNIANVKMEDNEREEGKSNYNFRKLISLWMNGFTSFSVKPLRMATFLGGLTAFAGVIYTMYIIISRLLNPDMAEGFSTIVSLQIIFSGVILMVLGMIGEYVGRIFLSLNKMPQYVIKEVVKSKSNIDDSMV